MSVNYDPDDFTEGEMDIAEQEKTFEGTVKFIAYFTLHVIAILIFLLIVGT